MIPRITAIVPCRNHGHLLGQCLEALAKQAEFIFEIIVVNDASTDSTAAVIEEFSAACPGLFRSITNHAQLGVARSINLAMTKTRSAYVGFFAADDYVLPGFFAEISRLIAENPFLGIFATASRWICHATGLQWIFPHVSTNSCVYLRDAVVQAGCYNADYKWHADWFLTSVIIMRHDIAVSKKVLSVFNLHPRSYYYSAKSVSERIAVIDSMLTTLNTLRYLDAGIQISELGLVGNLGMSGFIAILRRRSHWHHLNLSYTFRLAVRLCEVIGRKLPVPIQRRLLHAYAPDKT